MCIGSGEPINARTEEITRVFYEAHPDDQRQVAAAGLTAFGFGVVVQYVMDWGATA